MDMSTETPDLRPQPKLQANKRNSETVWKFFLFQFVGIWKTGTAKWKKMLMLSFHKKCIGTPQNKCIFLGGGTIHRYALVGVDREPFDEEDGETLAQWNFHDCRKLCDPQSVKIFNLNFYRL